jgi:hypothetical protein
MTWTEVFPLDIVRQNALQIYQVEAPGWGNVGAGAGANNLLSPRLATPLYGMAIDPDSDFDRVNIVPSVNGAPSPKFTDRIPVSKDSMLAGRFSFPRIKDYDGGFFIACPNDHRYGDTYVDTDGTIQPFGTVLGIGSPFPPAGLRFRPPVLRAILYIDALTAPPIVPRRAPKTHTQISETTGAADAFLVVSVHGRKRIRVTCLYTGANNPHVVEINGVTQPTNTGFPLATMSLVPGAVQSVICDNLACMFVVIKAPADPTALTVKTLVED